MNSWNNSARWTTISLIALASAQAQAQAQQSAAPEADAVEESAASEIVVTAQRRAQSIQDVPISISAFNQATMDKQGVKRVDDLARLTPGLNFTRGDARSSGLSTISIRGIASSGGAETTGIYIDDTPIQIRRLGFAVGNTYPRVFDLERVEVLRGPQGTLFGAGSEGGTVRFLSPNPNFDRVHVYGRAELAYTEHGEPTYEVGAAVGAPLSDKVAVRVSGWYRRDGGWIDRVNYIGGDLQDRNSNWSDAVVLRGALAFKPTEALTITPSVFYQREYANSPSVQWEQLSNPDKGIYQSANSITAFNRDRFILPSLKVEAELGADVSITSISSYFSRRQHMVADYTTLDRAALFGANPYPVLGDKGVGDFQNTQKNFNQEIRLQSTSSSAQLRWVFGAFYQRAKQNAVQYVDDPTIAAQALARIGRTFTQLFGQEPVNGTIIYIQDPYRGLDKQLAGFGQVDFDILERLTLTAGLRVARTKFSGSASFGAPFGGLPFSSSGRQSETPVTPKFSIAYKFDRNNNVYATASKGFRVGGYNPAQLSICNNQINSLGIRDIIPDTYDSDSLWSYEVGTKNALFDRRVRVDVSAFYIDWKNIQQFVRLSSCGGGFVGNLGSATSKGFDLQISATPVDELTFTAAVGYQNAKFNETIGLGTGTATLVRKGEHVVGSPWTIALSGQYDVPLAEDRTAYGRVDYQFKSKQSSRVPDQGPTNVGFNPNYYAVPETHFVSVRGGIKFSQFDLSLFVDNLFDSNKTLSRSSESTRSPLFRTTTFRPRTIGLTGTVRY